MWWVPQTVIAAIAAGQHVGGGLWAAQGTGRKMMGYAGISSGSMAAVSFWVAGDDTCLQAAMVGLSSAAMAGVWGLHVARTQAVATASQAAITRVLAVTSSGLAIDQAWTAFKHW